jgi:hypothetical protein
MDEKMLAVADEYTDTEVAVDAEGIPPQGKVVQQSFAAVQVRAGTQPSCALCSARVISDCHFAVQLNHFIPGFLSYSVPVFLK